MSELPITADRQRRGAMAPVPSARERRRHAQQELKRAERRSQRAQQRWEKAVADAEGTRQDVSR